MKKAFMTVEAVIFIGIIFLLFGASYVLYINKSIDLSQSRQELQEKADCMRAASALTAIHVLGNGARATIEIDNALILEEQRIETNTTFCTFPVASNRTRLTLVPGNITIIANDGYIEVVQ